MEKPRQQMTVLAGRDACLYCACYIGCMLAAKSMWRVLLSPSKERQFLTLHLPWEHRACEEGRERVGWDGQSGRVGRGGPGSTARLGTAAESRPERTRTGLGGALKSRRNS